MGDFRESNEAELMSISEPRFVAVEIEMEAEISLNSFDDVEMRKALILKTWMRKPVYICLQWIVFRY